MKYQLIRGALPHGRIREHTSAAKATKYRASNLSILDTRDRVDNESWCYHSCMRFPSIEKVLLTGGAATCGLGIGLNLYVESPRNFNVAHLYDPIWSFWIVIGGLLALLLGAVVWAIRTTAKRCLLAASCAIVGGTLFEEFCRIDIQGPTAIFFPMVIGAVLIVFLLLVIALDHWLVSKIGKYAHWVAALPIGIAGLALFINMQIESPRKGPPEVVPGTKISKLIKALPKEVKFSLSGLSFYDDELYVGTNLGIVEVSAGKPVRLYQFQSYDSVVSGPWLDRSDHMLWATDDHVHGLLRFDGNKWIRMDDPMPTKGFYTRGDVLAGLRPIGNSKGFWLCTAGTTWSWNGRSSGWVQIAYPHFLNLPDAGEVIGALPIGEDPLLIVRKQMLSFLAHDDDFISDEVVDSGNPTETQLARSGKPILADTWAVSADAGYICTTAQKLIRVTKEGVAPLEAPGACEAVAADEDLNLLVSIRTKGVFRFAQGRWSLIAESPYPSGAGDYWTYLSSSSGHLALAIDAQPVVDPHSSD